MSQNNEGWPDAEGVAESSEVATEGMGGQGGGIANDFTSSCGTWLELEKRGEGEGEGRRNSGRGNEMGLEILLMEGK